MITTIEITGLGGTINYPIEVIIKALKEAGISVEVENDYPSDNPDEMISLIKKQIDSGEIKDWKINIKTKNIFWGG